MAQSTTNKRGFTTIELLIAMVIFTIFSLGVFNLALDTLNRDQKIELDNEALKYAQEGIEAVVNMRDRNFLNITNGDHGLAFESDSWSFIAAPEDIDGFYDRTITVEDVFRDIGGEIAASGDYDPDTKKIISDVLWAMNGVDHDVSLSTYVSNWTGDDWIQTLCSEFDGGTYTDTSPVPVDGPPADNCAIQLEFIELPSEFFSSANLGNHGEDIAVSGNYAYVTNAKTSNGFSVIDISDPENPSELAELNVGGKGRNVAVSGSYAYVTIEKKNPGFGIVNISSPSSPSLVSTLNIGDYGSDLYISGNYAYVGVDQSSDSFTVIDISNKSNPSVVATLDFGDGVQDVEIYGDYAYIGLDDDEEGFKIVDISNPLLPQEVASLDVGEEVNAIEVNGIFAFIGIEDSSDSFKVINIVDNQNPSITTSLDVQGEITDLAVAGDYVYAALDDQNAGLAAINIENPTSPDLAYNLDITGKGTGVEATNDYIYLTTRTNNKGLVIIGTTSSEYITIGYYISNIYDTGSSDTRYNFVEWEHVEIPGGSVKFQIRTANTEGGIESANWVGSDGTGDTYYENARTMIELDPGRSGQKYFQFLATIESNGAGSPSIESVRVNYTP